MITADQDEKRAETRYETNASAIFRTFHALDYHRAKVLNHSGGGISIETDHRLKPGTIIHVRREGCPDTCIPSKACESCRTTTLATIHWCKESNTAGEASYSAGAKYFPYGIGY